MKLYIKEFYKEEKYHIETHPHFKNHFRIRCGLNCLYAYASTDNISYWSNNVKGETPIFFFFFKHIITSLDSKIQIIYTNETLH